MLSLAFVVLTVLLLLAFYRTGPGLKLSHGLPWDTIFSFSETTNAEQVADLEFITLTGLSAVIAAVLLVIATGLNRFLRRR